MTTTSKKRPCSSPSQTKEQEKEKSKSQSQEPRKRKGEKLLQQDEESSHTGQDPPAHMVDSDKSYSKSQRKPRAASECVSSSSSSPHLIFLLALEQR